MTITITVHIGPKRLVQRNYSSFQAALADIADWLTTKYAEESAQEKRT